MLYYRYIRFNGTKFHQKFCSSFLLYPKNWRHGALFLFFSHTKISIWSLLYRHRQDIMVYGPLLTITSYSEHQDQGRKDFAHMEFQIEMPIIDPLRWAGHTGKTKQNHYYDIHLTLNMCQAVF